MKLKILGSSSNGNCYVLETRNESLIIECGIRLSRIKRALGWRLSNVVGAFITHSHNDHAGHATSLATSGVTVFASADTLRAKGLYGKPFTREIRARHGYAVGGFRVIPLDVKHDVSCFAFIIGHAEIGKMLFVTDAIAFPYVVDGLNTILIEANYSDEILQENIVSGLTQEAMRPRLMNSHMELSETLRTLDRQDLSECSSIVLVHLSATNSDAAMFAKQVREHTGKPVYIASSGKEIDISKKPY